VCVCVCVCVCTSCYPQHPHDPDDGGVDGQRRAHLQLLQGDAHDGQRHDADVQLVPPAPITQCHGEHRYLRHPRVLSARRTCVATTVNASPVFEEAVDAERRQLEQRLDHEDAGEHVVAVLQNLL